MSMQTFGLLLAAFSRKQSLVDSAIAGLGKRRKGISVIQFTCIKGGSIKSTASALVLTCTMTIKHASPSSVENVACSA